MKRREFITLLGSAAAAWPIAVRAQQPAMPVVGFLNGQTASGFTHLAAAFRRGLSEAGFSEGQNVRIEYRWADGNLDRVRALADELVRQRVAVIAAGGGAHLIARDIMTIPIVFAIGGDPVKAGLVASINHPGGNATGVMVFTSDLEAKRLELLHELVPKDAIIGVLLDPKGQPAVQEQLQEISATARALGRQVHVLNVSTDTDMDQAFATVVERGITAVAVTGSPFFLNRRDRLLTLIDRHRIPAIFENREFTLAGGLMSYGTSVPDVYRRIGVYVGRILQGEKPADLPVLLPTKFDIAVNRKSAKALGIEFPISILLRADEVIE
jgi:putative ABC transport system substrate-binding protein